jgi:hypothetical protein
VEKIVRWFEKHGNDPGVGGKFTDPILILTDAYARSKSPAVRRDIASALRRALTGLGVKGRSDGTFVANAVRWYQDNKDRVEYNLDYGLNASASYFVDYRTNPIFNVRGQDKRQDKRDRGMKRGHH